VFECNLTDVRFKFEQVTTVKTEGLKFVKADAKKQERCCVKLRE